MGARAFPQKFFLTQREAGSVKRNCYHVFAIAALKRGIESAVLTIRRLKFHLLFKNAPGPEEFCNSKLIDVYPNRRPSGRPNRSLVIIRCGDRHSLVDDGAARTFDIALNAYAKPDPDTLNACNYLYVGGVNKYKAAVQFLTEDLVEKYQGFMFLDDDLEVTYSSLNAFLDYCYTNELALAQPSLSPDSFTSHTELLNRSACGHRVVNLVEVMCPFFSRESLRSVIQTFRLSYSTWGLDVIWPKLLQVGPVVVDQFQIKHLKPMQNGGAFYTYMKSIGISPKRELARLCGMPLERARVVGQRD